MNAHLVPREDPVALLLKARAGSIEVGVASTRSGIRDSTKRHIYRYIFGVVHRG